MPFKDANLVDECIDKTKEVDIEGLIKLAKKMTPHKRDEEVIKREIYEFMINIINSKCGGETEMDAITNWEYFLNTYENEMKNKILGDLNE